MVQPTLLRIKRKRDEEPPEILLLESRNPKRAATNLHYVREPSKKNPTAAAGEPHQRTKTGEGSKRVFQLERKRKSQDDEGKDGGMVATITEKRSRSLERKDDDGEQMPKFEALPEHPPLKKTSGRATVKTPAANNANSVLETEAERKRMEELSEYMQETFLEDEHQIRQKQRRISPSSGILAQERRQVTPPKLSGKRSSEIHKQRIASNDALPSTRKASAKADISDYVYDTYILAPKRSTEPMDLDADVGYLIITEEDEALWETYFIDEETAKKDLENDNVDEDEEDENAEGFYGADYPEHDLDEEDEFGRGDYGWRSRGGEEEWDEREDEDAGYFSSGDEDEDEEEAEKGFSAVRYREMAVEFLKT